MRALITGANSLLNQTLLTRLIELGYQVVAHYHTDNELTSKIKSSYPGVKLIQADFAQPTSYDNFLQSALRDGQYNVVVNGAVYYAEARDAIPQLSWQAW